MIGTDRLAWLGGGPRSRDRADTAAPAHGLGRAAWRTWGKAQALNPAPENYRLTLPRGGGVSIRHESAATHERMKEGRHVSAAGSTVTLGIPRSAATSANGPRAGLLTIGEVARRSGFTIKALRFYERRELLPPSGRRPSGYRLYSEADLHRLEFIRQAKALGLTLEAIRELVVAARRPGGASARTRLLRMLGERIAQTTRHIATLTRLRKELERRRRVLARPPHGNPGRGYCTCLQPGGEAGVEPRP